MQVAVNWEKNTFLSEHGKFQIYILKNKKVKLLELWQLWLDKIANEKRIIPNTTSKKLTFKVN